MHRKSWVIRIGFAFCAFVGLAASPHAQTLRIGLAEDPDVLDPTQARTFVGRIVFASLCDKLVDIDENLKIVPQLATSWEWSADNKALTMTLRQGVTFQDGEPFNAEAVKFNIERHKTMQGSTRKAELSLVSGVGVVDPYTVRIDLSAPFVPLLATLADRAGMMVSPRAAQAEGDKFGAHPVCSGPFKFVERVAQDRIVVEKYAGYWNKDAVHFDKVMYLPVVDNTVRLANLQSGQLDFIERLGTSDVPAVDRDSRLKAAKIVGLGYQGLDLNVGKSDIAKTTVLRDPRVREALDLSLDREAIVQVAMDGQAVPGDQWVSPNNPFFAKDMPVPQRDVAKAKALLKEAGVASPSFTLMTPTTNEAQKLAQIVQAMASEAGFNIKIQSTEFATSLDLADKGQFEGYVLEWSGRADPDGNLMSFLSCGGPQNYPGYCKPEMDALLKQERTTSAPQERQQVFDHIAAMALEDHPRLYLYNRYWLWAYNKKLTGVRLVPDALLRVQGLKME
ncbi:MAG: ABC transporter substrate-binding protein [Alphaproteobacteria bacterium]|nr:ABC transporter substrate-binding protein [Alphaproteobacteria bacterium]